MLVFVEGFKQNLLVSHTNDCHRFGLQNTKERKPRLWFEEAKSFRSWNSIEKPADGIVDFTVV